MRFLHKIYYDNKTLEILHLYCKDEQDTKTDDEIDSYVFSVIGNDPETVSIIVFPEYDADIEGPLKSGMIPKISIDSTYTDEGGNETHTYRLDFVPREEGVQIPTYGELAALWDEIEEVL